MSLINIGPATGILKSTSGVLSYINGTAAQFVKGDGSLDSNTYLTGNQPITLTGDVTGGPNATSIATTIGANAVTFAKFQQVNAASLVGNPSGVLGNASQITLGSGLSFSGSVLNISSTSTVASVTNSDGTLTISPTVGAVVASIALGHSNTWTVAQTINVSTTTPLVIGNTTSGGTLTLQSTSNATRGLINLGSAATSFFDEANSYLKIVTSGLAVTPTLTSGIYLQNATAAAVNAQQISPPFIQEGSGWKTTATAGPQSVKFQQFVLPVQGAASPGGTWTLQVSINAGAFGTAASVTESGVLTLNNPTVANSAGTVGPNASGNFVVNWGGGNGKSLILTSSGNQAFVLLSQVSVATWTVGGMSLTASNPVTSTIVDMFAIGTSFAPATGAQANNGMRISQTINQTGSATGITRGLYVNPTLTLAVDFRAIEVSAGDSLLRNAKLSVAGDGLYIKEGANATMGIATLVAGAATVSTTKVTANSRVHLTTQALGGIAAPVGVAVTARTAGTSFTITSASALDTSTVAWVILEPA